MRQDKNASGIGSAAKRDRVERELIDARGSIDSRTFNEEQRISSTAKDARDRHAASVETANARSHWHSRSGQRARGAACRNRQSALRDKASTPKQSSNIGFTRSVLSGPADYTTPDRFSTSNVPPLLKIAVPAIILLAIIAIVVAVF